MRITVRPLTSGRWSDFETVFEAEGCSVARGCWCLYYRESGRQPVPRGLTLAAARKQRMQALVDAGPPPGLIGYRGKTPVGWISLGPRDDFAKLRRSPVMKAVDELPVWSVICFVVPSRYRRQGVARALLAAAIDYARRRGATLLEAYPVDKSGRGRDDSYWFGSRSMFDATGFEEVARRKPTRPIVRLRLA